MKTFFSTAILGLLLSVQTFGQGILVDHRHAKLELIPVWALQQATEKLHIAYGHTLYGSQLMTGMTELENQDTILKGYKGDYYCWNYYENPGENGPCLDIFDRFRPGDLGYLGETKWADYTREFLENDPKSEDINVIVWAWGDGCSNNTVEGINTYLTTMNQLESEYPDIQFVYMTGHRDIWRDSILKRNNQLIRDYCIANDKILYDFADIESWDPDGKYFKYAHYNCNYYDEKLNKLGNWATEWENSHVEGVDWFYSLTANSQSLNGNLKAYSAWWLWCRLAGWDGDGVGTWENKDENDVHIYASGKNIVLRLSGRQTARVSVFNLTGQQLLSERVTETESKLGTNFPSGIYFIRVVFSDGRTVSRKIYLP